MLIKLDRFDDRLQGIHLILGAGFPVTSNIYVIGKQEVTLIDSGRGDKTTSLKLPLQKIELDIENVVNVIVTHSHFDHIGGLRELHQRALFTTFIHEAESNDIKGLVPKQKLVTLKDGDVIDTQLASLEVIHTPGHSRGAICLYDRTKNILFSGDTVFPNGLFGRWDLEGGDARALVTSLEQLTTLDVEILCPGHERPVFQNAKNHIRLSYETAKNYCTSPASYW